MTIEFRNLSLRLGDKQVFDRFNLMIAPAEKVLLRGPSGRGKSTLLRLLLGFAQPDDGGVFLDGEKVTARNVWSFRRRMAFVSQDLNIGTGKVSAFFREALDFQANQQIDYDENRILDYFEHFALEPDKLEQSLGALSGGEKQRVALILALLLDREVYLLDEVTSSIDEALRATVIRYLRRIEGKTMVVVSHDQGWEGFREIEL